MQTFGVRQLQLRLVLPREAAAPMRAGTLPSAIAFSGSYLLMTLPRAIDQPLQVLIRQIRAYFPNIGSSSMTVPRATRECSQFDAMTPSRAGRNSTGRRKETYSTLLPRIALHGKMTLSCADDERILPTGNDATPCSK